MKAEIVKAVVVEDWEQSTHLMAVAECDQDLLNLSFEYDWQNLDKEWLFKELRDKIADAFDVRTDSVDINKSLLQTKMINYELWKQGIIVNDRIANGAS